MKLNMWVADATIPFDLTGMETDDDYSIKTREPLEPGMYAFHTQGVLTSVDTAALDKLPSEMRVAFPFEVRDFPGKRLRLLSEVTMRSGEIESRSLSTPPTDCSRWPSGQHCGQRRGGWCGSRQAVEGLDVGAGFGRGGALARMEAGERSVAWAIRGFERQTVPTTGPSLTSTDTE